MLLVEVVEMVRRRDVGLGIEVVADVGLGIDEEEGDDVDLARDN